VLNFGVTEEKMRSLLQRMAACGLREEDLTERFVSSSGPGGQKTNRTATCVYLLHVPSGSSVKMQKARSQALNRFYARRRLCELMEGDALGEGSAAAQKAAKIRKQRKRRHRRSTSRQPKDCEDDGISNNSA